MAINFDTLGYCQYLMNNGVEEKQAQALTYAALDYFMPEPATKADFLAAVDTQNASNDQKMKPLALGND